MYRNFQQKEVKTPHKVQTVVTEYKTQPYCGSDSSKQFGFLRK